MTDDPVLREVLAAIRQALTAPDAFHELAERYERSVHATLTRGDSPDPSPEDGRQARRQGGAMADNQQPIRYREDAERMRALALAAATPEMRAEFMRIASMYEVLASRVGPHGTLNPPGRTAPDAARE